MITVKPGSVVFQNVRKTFGAFTAIPSLLDDRPGHARDAPRSIRLRKDDDPSNACWPRASELRPYPDRRQGCHHATRQ